MGISREKRRLIKLAVRNGFGFGYEVGRRGSKLKTGKLKEFDEFDNLLNRAYVEASRVGFALGKRHKSESLQGELGAADVITDMMVDIWEKTKA